MSEAFYDQAPGNILQNMYLKRRLNLWAKPGMRFLEMGAGNGAISRILLDHGLEGLALDLNGEACQANRLRNQDYIDQGQFEVRAEDFFSLAEDTFDIIITSHVIEHLPNDLLYKYFEKCQSLLGSQGRVISLVPANMSYWCIEDQTAGHYRRFENSDFKQIAESQAYKVAELSGLTYSL